MPPQIAHRHVTVLLAAMAAFDAVWYEPSSRSRERLVSVSVGSRGPTWGGEFPDASQGKWRRHVLL